MPKMPLLIPTKTTSSQLIASDMVNQELNYANLGDILGYRTTSGALRRIFTNVSMVRNITLDSSATQTLDLANNASGVATGFIAPITVLYQSGSGMTTVDKTLTISHGATPLAGSQLYLIASGDSFSSGSILLANTRSSTPRVNSYWAENKALYPNDYINAQGSAIRRYIWEPNSFMWHLDWSNELTAGLNGAPSTLLTMSATSLSDTTSNRMSSYAGQRAMQNYYRYNDISASVDCGTNNIDTTNRVSGQMTTIDVRASASNVTLTLPSGNTYEIINTISSYRVIPITNTANERTKITLLWDGARFHVNYANYKTA